MSPSLRSSSGVAEGPSTPHSKEARRAADSLLLALPRELLERTTVANADWKDLCAIGATCTALRTLAQASRPPGLFLDCDLWRQEWIRVYGEPGAVQEAAAAKAGSWKALFAARTLALRETEPWLKPSSFEVQASVDMLTAPLVKEMAEAKDTAAGAEAATPAAGDEASVPAAAIEGDEGEGGLCLVFLVDGSGSVTEEDFRVMTEFMLLAVRSVAAGGSGGGGGGGEEAAAAAATVGEAASAAPPRAKVAVIQFSNDVRVEQGPVEVDVPAFEALMAGMGRMNGGTNIALAVQKAGQLLKPLSPSTRRVLVLLTDGRIDSHQAVLLPAASREARDMAARLGDEQANVRLHAYGVGRGVDKQELLRICAARDPDTAEDRYLALMVLDEAPW
ncbi:hypothetical protein ACK3TF_001693 [Chlorella vulgaris]